MKRLISLVLTLALLTASVPALALNMTVQVRDVTSGIVANRVVTVTLVNPTGPAVAGSWVLAGDLKSLTTDATGSVTFSNLLTLGAYRLDISGNPSRSFPFNVAGATNNNTYNFVQLLGTNQAVQLFYNTGQIDAMLAQLQLTNVGLFSNYTFSVSMTNQANQWGGTFIGTNVGDGSGLSNVTASAVPPFVITNFNGTSVTITNGLNVGTNGVNGNAGGLTNVQIAAFQPFPGNTNLIAIWNGSGWVTQNISAIQAAATNAYSQFATNATGTGNAMTTNETRGVAMTSSANQISGNFTGDGSALASVAGANLGTNSPYTGSTMGTNEMRPSTMANANNSVGGDGSQLARVEAFGMAVTNRLDATGTAIAGGNTYTLNPANFSFTNDATTLNFFTNVSGTYQYFIVGSGATYTNRQPGTVVGDYDGTQMAFGTAKVRLHSSFLFTGPGFSMDTPLTNTSGLFGPGGGVTGVNAVQLQGMDSNRFVVVVTNSAGALSFFAPQAISFTNANNSFSGTFNGLITSATGAAQATNASLTGSAAGTNDPRGFNLSNTNNTLAGIHTGYAPLLQDVRAVWATNSPGTGSAVNSNYSSAVNFTNTGNNFVGTFTGLATTTASASTATNATGTGTAMGTNEMRPVALISPSTTLAGTGFNLDGVSAFFLAITNRLTVSATAVSGNPYEYYAATGAFTNGTGNAISNASGVWGIYDNLGNLFYTNNVNLYHGNFTGVLGANGNASVNFQRAFFSRGNGIVSSLFITNLSGTIGPAFDANLNAYATFSVTNPLKQAAYYDTNTFDLVGTAGTLSSGSTNSGSLARTNLNLLTFISVFPTSSIAPLVIYQTNANGTFGPTLFFPTNGGSALSALAITNGDTRDSLLVGTFSVPTGTNNLINASNIYIGDKFEIEWTTNVVYVTTAGDSDVTNGNYYWNGSEYTNWWTGGHLTNVSSSSWVFANFLEQARYTSSNGNLTNTTWNLSFGSNPKPVIHFGNRQHSSATEFTGVFHSTNVTWQIQHNTTFSNSFTSYGDITLGNSPVASLLFIDPHTTLGYDVLFGGLGYLRVDNVPLQLPYGLTMWNSGGVNLTTYSNWLDATVGHAGDAAIYSGPVVDSQLSGNVALLAGSPVFSTPVTFTAGITNTVGTTWTGTNIFLNSIISNASVISVLGNLYASNFVGGGPNITNHVTDPVQAIFSVKDPPFGAKGDGRALYNIVMSAGSPNITNATSVFVAGDAGKSFTMWGAGISGYNLSGTIVSVTSGTVAVLSTNAVTSSTNLFKYGTDDTAAIQAGWNFVCSNSVGGTLYFPAGNYMVAGALQDPGYSTNHANAQITTPHIPKPVTVVMLGAMKAAGNYTGTLPGGSAIWSTFTNSPALTNQARILDTSDTSVAGIKNLSNGGPTYFAHFQNARIVIEDLEFDSPFDNGMAEIDLYSMLQANIFNCAFTHGYFETGTTPPVPVNTNGISVVMPGSANYQESYIRDCSFLTAYSAAAIGGGTIAENCYFQGNVNNYAPRDNIGWVTVKNSFSQECSNHLYAPWNSVSGVFEFFTFNSTRFVNTRNIALTTQGIIGTMVHVEDNPQSVTNANFSGITTGLANWQIRGGLVPIYNNTLQIGNTNSYFTPAINSYGTILGQTNAYVGPCLVGPRSGFPTYAQFASTNAIAAGASGVILGSGGDNFIDCAPGQQTDFSHNSIGTIDAVIGSSLITFNNPVTNSAGVQGYSAASPAAAGLIGEVFSSKIAFTSATSLQTTVPTNVTSINLTAGDWDVSGNVTFTNSAATIGVGGVETSAGIGTTTGAIPSDGTECYGIDTQTTSSDVFTIALPSKQINVSTTTTVYLTGQCAFSAGGVKVFGSIRARRVR